MARKPTPKKPEPTPKAKPTRRPQRQIPEHELAHINASLRGSIAPVAELIPDPKNANKHNQRSIDEIAKSYQQFGQLKPLVVHKDSKVVIAGNGQLAAAKQLGFKYLAVAWVEMDPTQQTGYAIADNRTAQFAEWDQHQLAELLQELEDSGAMSAADVGFQPEELDAIIKSANDAIGRVSVNPGGDDDPEGEDDPEERNQTFEIVITCRDEQHQKDLIAQLSTQGVKAKAQIV